METVFWIGTSLEAVFAAAGDNRKPGIAKFPSRNLRSAYGPFSPLHGSEERGASFVTAILVKGTERHLSDKIRFWVVRARVAAGEVSGLGTLFAEAYTVKTRWLLHFSGSVRGLTIGTPVEFRGIRIGQALVELSKEIAAEIRKLAAKR